MDYTDDINSAYDDIGEFGADVVIKNELGTLSKKTDTITFPRAFLTNAITSSATSIVINAATGSSPSVGIIQIGDEKILYETKTGQTLSTITRGYDGTTAASAATGATISFLYEAAKTKAIELKLLNTEYLYGDRWKVSHEVLVGKKMLLISAKNVNITFDESSFIDWNNYYTYTIEMNAPIAPSGDAIIYKTVIKK